MQYSFKIDGQVPSKSNCYKIITIAGHASLAKTNAVKEFEKIFFLQCPFRSIKKTEPLVKGYFAADIKVFYENMRPDVDNAAKVLLDCMQTCGLIKNDRNCVDLHIKKFVDKTNPRIEILVEDII